MLKKIKKICCNTKALIIVLVILMVIGFGLAIYFGIKTSNLKREFSDIGPKEKLEKIHAYATALEKFEEFKKKQGAKNTTFELEKAVLSTNSGVLKALFDEILLGENLEKDMEYFLEAVIDSLKFFSK